MTLESIKYGASAGTWEFRTSATLLPFCSSFYRSCTAISGTISLGFLAVITTLSSVLMHQCAFILRPLHRDPYRPDVDVHPEFNFSMSRCATRTRVYQGSNYSLNQKETWIYPRFIVGEDPHVLSPPLPAQRMFDGAASSDPMHSAYKPLTQKMVCANPKRPRRYASSHPNSQSASWIPFRLH